MGKKTTYIICDEIDARNLLVHLNDIGERDSVEFAILGHLEQTPVGALGHFFHGGLNSFELGLDDGVVTRLVVKTFEDLQSVISSTLHHEPPRGFGKVEN